jgi:hypothetical protein
MASDDNGFGPPDSEMVNAMGELDRILVHYTDTV